MLIHQFPDWTHFSYDSRRVLDALGKTRLAEGRLLGIAQMCNLGKTESILQTRDIMASLSIDDHESNEESARKLADTWGLGKKSIPPLTLERLADWHAFASGDRHSLFRTTESEVVFHDELSDIRFAGPGPERLQNELINFVTWFEITPMDGLIKAALAQFWFLTIRPFNNHNGLLARAITAIQLARAEDNSRCLFSVNEQILKNRVEYFRILGKTQGKDGDLTEWIMWFLKMARQAINESEKIFETEITRFAFQSKHAGKVLNTREQQLVNAIFEGIIPESFTSKDAAALFGTSHDTALREIQNLVSKGILYTNQKGGRSQRYSLNQ